MCEHLPAVYDVKQAEALSRFRLFSSRLAFPATPRRIRLNVEIDLRHALLLGIFWLRDMHGRPALLGVPIMVLAIVVSVHYCFAAGRWVMHRGIVVDALYHRP